MNLKHFAIGVAIFTASSASANEQMSRVVEMIDDLGGDMATLPANSGKTLACAQGGTKKVTITFKDDSIHYLGEYYNCREDDSVRDSIIDMTVSADGLASGGERLTINGELYDAVLNNDLQLVKKLLRKKPDLNLAGGTPQVFGGEAIGWTPLMTAVANGNADIVRLLIRHGAWVNYLNSDVRSALWYAASNGNAKIVRLLLDGGAYVDNADAIEITPLMVAVTNGHVEVVKLLVKHTAQLNMKHRDGDTALMFAVARGNREIVRTLLDAGADVNIANKHGITPLIICAVENHVEIARILIGKGADISAKTDFGKTAQDIATAKGHTEIAALLSAAVGQERHTEP
jgi:ankyrin repeat protein